jgi:hypothetical protein
MAPPVRLENFYGAYPHTIIAKQVSDHDLTTHYFN